MDEQIKLLFKKYLNPTRKSHFVKKEYLSAWSNDGKHIMTSRNGCDFISNNLSDVCTERDMYKMEKLTDLELDQVRTFYKDSPDCVKKVNEDFLTMWQLACTILENIDNPEYKQLAKNMSIQCGEDLQSTFESALDDDIKRCLLKLDDSFLRNDEKLLNFGFYIFSQYLRTQKHKNKTNDSLANSLNFAVFKGRLNPKKLWNVLITIMSNMAAYTLFTRNDKNHICFIKSEDGLLLTSDQPVVNIAKDINHDYAKFYYPISPYIGIIFPVEEPNIIKNIYHIIEEMNNYIICNSYRTIFKLK